MPKEDLVLQCWLPFTATLGYICVTDNSLFRSSTRARRIRSFAPIPRRKENARHRVMGKREAEETSFLRHQPNGSIPSAAGIQGVHVAKGQRFCSRAARASPNAPRPEQWRCAIHRSWPLGSMPIRRFVFADPFMTSAPVMAREQLVRQLRDRDSARRIASAAHLATYIALY
ncbi:hypothetical protein CPLU01_06947 [Colletotrichum plurivorum]|uniref:Uncharacterized protein n=1 Tax=Colletotrichum plurivorum TaxID=2175906 RepID=A0A8H6NF54_9PEZI|nr:hypothetical protein CPLU01_06947 [Colletotrichum plurivorum]